MLTNSGYSSYSFACFPGIRNCQYISIMTVMRLGAEEKRMNPSPSSSINTNKKSLCIALMSFMQHPTLPPLFDYFLLMALFPA